MRPRTETPAPARTLGRARSVALALESGVADQAEKLWNKLFSAPMTPVCPVTSNSDCSGAKAVDWAR